MGLVKHLCPTFMKNVHGLANTISISLIKTKAKAIHKKKPAAVQF